MKIVRKTIKVSSTGRDNLNTLMSKSFEDKEISREHLIILQQTSAVVTSCNLCEKKRLSITHAKDRRDSIYQRSEIPILG